MKIYLASPFFNEKEIEIVARGEQILRSRGFEVFSPREHEDREHEMGSVEWSRTIFAGDKAGIYDSDVMVMLYHGNYSDSGTAWECGFAFALGKPVIVVHVGEDSNLMVHEGSHANITMDELMTYDFETLPEKIYTGKMI